MRTVNTKRKSLQRRGSATLEEVLILTFMLPISALSAFTAIRVMQAIFQVIASTVGAAFL